MNVTSRVVGPLQENSYLVVDEATRRAAIIDPGAEPDVLVDVIRNSGATLEAIWITHAHIDHIAAIAGVQRAYPVPVFMHPDGTQLYARAASQAEIYGIPFEPLGPPDFELSDGQQLSLGSVSFEVLHTPGHAVGHVVLFGNGVLFAGDLLFAGSIGRTDLPFSDPVAMEASLTRVAALPEETVVYSGHGPATTIGRERATNPFLTGAARLIRR